MEVNNQEKAPVDSFNSILLDLSVSYNGVFMLKFVKLYPLNHVLYCMNILINKIQE